MFPYSTIISILCTFFFALALISDSLSWDDDGKVQKTQNEREKEAHIGTLWKSCKYSINEAKCCRMTININFLITTNIRCHAATVKHNDITVRGRRGLTLSSEFLSWSHQLDFLLSLRNSLLDDTNSFGLFSVPAFSIFYSTFFYHRNIESGAKKRNEKSGDNNIKKINPHMYTVSRIRHLLYSHHNRL